MVDVGNYLVNAGAKAAQDTVPTQTSSDPEVEVTTLAERKLRLKVDLHLCTIAGLLCSLNLLDSGLISSAPVTSML